MAACKRRPRPLRLSLDERDAFTDLVRPPAWTRDALCIEHPELNWFPELGETPAGTKAVCARCAVRDECLAYALAHKIQHGVWGGTSPNERRRPRPN